MLIRFYIGVTTFFLPIALAYYDGWSVSPYRPMHALTVFNIFIYALMHCSCWEALVKPQNNPLPLCMHGGDIRPIYFYYHLFLIEMKQGSGDFTYMGIGWLSSPNHAREGFSPTNPSIGYRSVYTYIY